MGKAARISTIYAGEVANLVTSYGFKTAPYNGLMVVPADASMISAKPPHSAGGRMLSSHSLL